VTQHHREQPHDAHDLGLVREDYLELREVDLRLAAGRGLEAPLEGLAPLRSDVAQVVGHAAVAAPVAQAAQLAQQPGSRQFGIGPHALAKVVLERVEQLGPRGPWAVARALQPLREILAHRLAVEPGLAGDGAQRQALNRPGFPGGS
jgi:hypothetical protein